jgi:hypothetical protein
VLSPASWLWIGSTHRNELAITLRLPWRKRMYDCTLDGYVIGYPRIGLRIRWGTSVDRTKIVQPCAGVSDPFASVGRNG